MTTTLTQTPEPKATRKASAGVEGGQPGGHTTQIVSFRLANEEYGVDIMRVQEVILLGQITQMPEVPDYICGLINLRGHVIPIIDLRKRFELPVAESDEHTRIVVVNVGRRTLGIIVDAVNEVLRISGEQVEPPPSSVAGIDHAYVKGLVKFKEKLLILLDIESVLSAEDQTGLAAACAS